MAKNKDKPGTRYVTLSQLDFLIQETGKSAEALIRELEEKTGWRIQLVEDAAVDTEETVIMALPQRTYPDDQTAKCSYCGITLYLHKNSPWRPGMKVGCPACVALVEYLESKAN
jgi:hypothetical protein